MDENKIINILQSFSKIHGFEYDKTPVPYIPFGGIRGSLNDSTFTLYISRSESRVHGRLHTHFTLTNQNLVPTGFCIEYVGNPNKKGKGFDDRIADRSNGDQINVLTPQIKINLTSAFDRIDEIDEEIFKVRSFLRISENGIALEVGVFFQNVEELNTVYAKVIEILIGIKSVLLRN
jgi:hypothetical protein